MKKSYIWVVVALLWVVALLNYVDRQVIFSVLPLVARDLRVPESQLGLLSGAFLWIYGIVSPLAGFLTDRFGRRPVILASLLIWSAVTYATGLARSFPEVLAARALMGVSEACYLPAALALIATFHPAGTRSLATGLHLSGVYVGTVLGSAGGGWVGEHYGWRAPFAFLGLAGVVYSFVLMFSLREPRTPAATASTSEKPAVKLVDSLRQLLRLPGFLRMTAAFGGMSIANWLIYTWMSFYLYERFGLRLAAPALAGFLKSAIGLDGAFRVAAVVVLACGLLLARLRCSTPIAEES